MADDRPKQPDMRQRILRAAWLSILVGLGLEALLNALAFGLGGREWAADMLERWWPRRRKP